MWMELLLVGSHIEFHKKLIGQSFFKEEKVRAVNIYLKDKMMISLLHFETDDIVFMNKEDKDTKHNEEKVKSLTDKQCIY